MSRPSAKPRNVIRHYKYTLMKKYFCFAVTIFISFSLSAQIMDCPTENQKRYSCGDVKENILETVNRKDYIIKSHFNVRLVSHFRKDSDNERATKIVELCNMVLNEVDFWNALENYKGYRYAVFEDDNGKQQISGNQIVNCLINGNPKDTTRPLEVDIPLDIELYGASFKTFFESAVAKEIGDGKIYNKKWFFRGSTIDDIGSNWIHEFSHSKGLKHCYYCHEERDYSVPYVINRIFVEVAKKYIKDEE